MIFSFFLDCNFFLYFFLLFLGLEEANPLPKNISKKTSTVDKSAAVAAAKSTLKLNTSPLDRITEKKIKPENLLAINENANSKGIKLIPAKPRRKYILKGYQLRF